MKISRKFALIFCTIGLLAVIWLALLVAPSWRGGLPQMAKSCEKMLTSPLEIKLCENSLKTVVIFVAAYFLGIGNYFATRKNHRFGAEHGSAKWGDARILARKYADKTPENSKILTQNFKMSLNARKHQRNLNTVVVGGSGSGKTRFFALPNVLQANCSMVILDPKAEIFRATEAFLRQKNFEIKVLDLINMHKSCKYNPFCYLKSDNDAQKLATNIFKSTDQKSSNGGKDPFWDRAAQMLLLAIIFYLKYEAPPEKQNFSSVLDMLRLGEMQKNDVEQSTLDAIFEQLEMKNPQHAAVKYYKNYRCGADETLRSIQITLAARLGKFNLASLAKLTAKDELNLAEICEKETALFIILPDNDSSFNFLASILYTQIFQVLFYLADYKYGGFLPISVHFLMDEFANIALPDDFEKILSVMRSRGMFASIILQNLAQLKALFEKQWESILGNCDSFLYLGGGEKSTHKYVSELLGKETIATNSYGKSSGRGGNYSTNYQISGRELLTPDEVRMLENRHALLFLRGEKAIMDDKFDLTRHPNFKNLTGG